MKLKTLAGALTAALSLALLAPSALAQSAPGPVQALIRYPSIHGNTVVFEAGGAVWKVGVQGGEATRLTSDSGYDSHPLLSPDGKWVAFTGWYRGNTDVYVVSVHGGPVKQLTWRSINAQMHGKIMTAPDNVVIGWTPNSEDVVFLSRRESFNPQIERAFEVPVTGGLPVALPMPWTGPLSFNASGTVVAYNKLARVLRAFHRKHYYGGQADNIYTYDLASGASTQLTHWKGEDAYPMWYGNTLYFASDRGKNGVLNLWQRDLKTGATQQVTDFPTYDVDWPSLGNTGIALSDGGLLYVYSFATGKLTQVPVTVPLGGSRTLPYEYAAAKMIRGADIAPDGKLAVFSARGALFTVPAEYGHTTEISHTVASNDKDPMWSPNGKWIAYIRDNGVDSQVMLRAADGKGAPKALTREADITYAGPLLWSPNGDWLTYTDSRQRLWLVDVNTGARKEVTTDRQKIIGAFQDVAFSPDSRWLAFSKHLPNHLHALFIYGVDNGQLHQVSRGDFNDSNPAFSQDGKYLYFVSARLVNPVLSAYNFGASGVVPDGLYVTTLEASTPSPFAPRTQVPAASKPKSGAKGKTKGKKAKTPVVNIDFNGLIKRAVRVPVPAANIMQVAEAKGVVYYATMPVPVLGGAIPGEMPELRAYDLAKRKALTLAQGIGSGFALSADGSTLLYNFHGKWVLRPATFSPAAKAKPLNTSHMQMQVVPRAEWAEIFNEAWRNVRDYFVNPELIKAKWAAIGDRYRALLPLVQTREDLNYIMANMIGSLGESHMYIFGGDMGWKSPPQPTAGLGVEFALNVRAGRYYLKRIYHGDNTVPGYYAPLAQPGLKVKQGDYVLAINGKPLTASINPYELLQGTLGQTIALSIASTPDGTPWTILVKPVVNSGKLHLLHWINNNRREVNKLSDGKIGYVYLNDMEATGLHEFVRQYYSQLNKPGLIIDDRWNLGGFIDTILFNQLDQKPVAAWTNRHGAYYQSPEDAYVGHMAALINHGSASDGDIFAYRFQQYHLGPTIGSRTWGGVRGYDNTFPLLDGGAQVVSEIAMYGTNSKWVVENIGVVPSIEVHVNPGLLARDNRDTQIEKAVAVLLQEIKQHPTEVSPPPPWMPAFPVQPDYPPCPVTHGTCR
ncbi:S41 family peptidase [Metallibacterium sp.]|uniref:S41 family peptidase n=1 Tax=Metallibacterium sp. TaxID=2940281 RepID=UPI002605B636|nr:S41 family peptidase [Metallibacterium sp.]